MAGGENAIPYFVSAVGDKYFLCISTFKSRHGSINCPVLCTLVDKAGKITETVVAAPPCLTHLLLPEHLPMEGFMGKVPPREWLRRQSRDYLRDRCKALPPNIFGYAKPSKVPVLPWGGRPYLGLDDPGPVHFVLSKAKCQA